LYDLLRPDKARNPAFLTKQLGGEGLDEAIASVVEQGRAKWLGGRLLKVTGDDLTESAQLLLAELPADGSRIGNRQLRSRPTLNDLSADQYLGAKRDLVHQGLAVAGPGLGGTLARVIEQSEKEVRAAVVKIVARDPADTAVAPSRGLVSLEQELYEPFRQWEQDNVTVGDFAFATALVSATPLGYRRGRGEWTRPDVMSVSVWNTELLPGASVEVATYELKKADDTDKIANVYEAAAHGRWAHRSSLVLTRGRRSRRAPPEGGSSIWARRLPHAARRR